MKLDMMNMDQIPFWGTTAECSLRKTPLNIFYFIYVVT